MLIGCQNSNEKIEVLDSKYEGFSNFESLDERAEIIVIGTKVSEKKSFLSRSMTTNEVLSGHTPATFNITKVIKNSDDDVNIAVDNEIEIMEHVYIHDNTIYSYNGYKKMTENDEYMLFLMPEQDNIYAIYGLNEGKVPLAHDDVELLKTDEENNSSYDHDVNRLNKLYMDAKKKYIN